MREEYQYIFLKEKPLILQFLSERTRPDEKGYVYVMDLVAAYRGWRKVHLLGNSKLSSTSFARALPEQYARKLLNRGREGAGPARAVLGLVLK